MVHLVFLQKENDKDEILSNFILHWNKSQTRMFQSENIVNIQNIY